MVLWNAYGLPICVSELLLLLQQYMSTSTAICFADTLDSPVVNRKYNIVAPAYALKPT